MAPKVEGTQDAESALRRGALYGSFARGFGPVEMYMRDGRALHELRTLAAQTPQMQELVGKLLDGSKVDEDLQLLASERLRLFEKGECPPYEASYRGEEDPLKDVLMADVAGFYRAFGLEPRNELPDHLVSELEFMGLLCVKEAHALLNGNSEAAEVVQEAQAKFLADHLSRWIGKFRTAVQEQSRVNLYPALADMLVEFVGQETARLGIKAHQEAGEAIGA